MSEEPATQTLVENFIQTANAFDIEGILSLFASSAAIDDVSVGDAFMGKNSVRLYLERFFVGYNTASRLLSLEELDDFNALARVDFTGDVGH